MRSILSRAAVAALALVFTGLAGLAPQARADEGMWTFDAFPAALVKQKYGVDVAAKWLERVRLGSVRLDGGCSGSLVSPDGLVLTNHHCARSCIADRSTPERDLIAKGFVAGSRAAEERCESFRISVLVGTEDVTAKIVAATKGLTAAAEADARRKTRTALEQQCEADAKNGTAGPLKCETVELYQGGQYWLYRYKRYDDVRLAFAPEEDIAAFGGDPDNFQFPRWCLDMALLRVYENGQPAKTPNALKVDWSATKAGDPVFVSGHPGNTDRLLTVAQLEAQRDSLPFTLVRQSELRGRMLQYASTGAEPERQAAPVLASLENGLKVRRKQLDALLDDSILSARRAEEAKLRAWLAQHPEVAREVGDPWADIAKLQHLERGIEVRYTFAEGGAAFSGSQLYSYARSLVRSAAERGKPNAERLREYTDARLPALAQTLRARAPVYPEIEKIRITTGLERIREYLGHDDPLVRKLLGNDSPAAVAKRLVEGSKLADPAVRTSLYEGGAAAVAVSNDPFVVLYRAIDPEYRAMRKQFEDEIQGPTTAAQQRLSRIRFAALGTTTYPDATFTLRVSYGQVAGWTEPGKTIEPYTRIATAFGRATGEAPFRLPDSWTAAKDRIDMQTPFDVSTTNDIIGGNSGSPLLNAKGDVVGLVFDGNIHSIGGSFGYDPELNRTVAVDARVMREALTKVYRADALVREIDGAKPKKKS
jgi:hypothetical protein